MIDLTQIFISDAMAQGAPVAESPLASFLPIIFIILIFYFLMIRPQQKKMNEYKAMQEAVKRGDNIVTGGGIIGKVTSVQDDDTIKVEISQGVEVKIQRSSIGNIVAKKTANDNKKTK